MRVGCIVFTLAAAWRATEILVRVRMAEEKQSICDASTLALIAKVRRQSTIDFFDREIVVPALSRFDECVRVERDGK